MNRRNFITYTALLGGSAILESNTLTQQKSIKHLAKQKIIYQLGKKLRLML